MRSVALALIGVSLGVAGCSAEAPLENVIYENPLDSASDVLTKTGVVADPAISSDGRGSIRIDAAGPVTIALAEVRPEAAEHVTLFYRARLRAENLAGQAYLELWCVVPGKGEFFSRALQAPLSGTSDWVTQQTPFMLDTGQPAELVKLNLVLTGAGTVWIDSLSLSQAGP